MKKTIVVDVPIAQLPKHSAAQSQGLAVRGLADRSSRRRSATRAASIVAQGIGPLSGSSPDEMALGDGYWLSPETADARPASAGSTSTDATGPT